MRTLFFITAFLLGHYAFSCSCQGKKSFCYTASTAHPNNFIFSGKITTSTDTFIELELFDRLRGIESRDTIRIWDDSITNDSPFGQCYHRLKASSLGKIGDSILIILPKIEDSVLSKLPWGRKDDYLTPWTECITTPLVLIRNNSLVFSFFSYEKWETVHKRFSYTEFLDHWNNNGFSCDSLLAVGLKEQVHDGSFSIFPNPTNNLIRIQNSSGIAIESINLYTVQGKKLQEVMPSQGLETSLNIIGPKGLYLLQIQLQNGEQISKKVLKE